MKSQDIAEEARRANYRVVPQQLETLARQHYVHGDKLIKLEGTYLKCLVAAVKELAAGDNVLTVLEAVHAEYMPYLEKGVTTADVADDERKPRQERRLRRHEVHRRLTFARTSKADLKAYLTAGGPMEDLDPATVSRSQLRKFVSKKREKPNIDPSTLSTETEKAQELEVAVLTSFERMTKVIETIARIDEEDAEAALQIIQVLQDKLGALSEEIALAASANKRVQAYVAKQGERRGDLRLWPDASH